MNLRTRFVIVSATLMFVLATGMSVGAYRIASQQLQGQVERSLDQRASRILQIMDRPNFNWNDAFGPGPVNQAIMQTEVDAITQIVLPNGMRPTGNLALIAASELFCFSAVPKALNL